MRFGYFAYEHRKTTVNDTYLEHIGFAEVNPVLRKHEVYVERLRAWAIDLLRTGRHEAGLFNFCYGEITDQDEPGDMLADIFLAWDGEEELVSPETSEIGKATAPAT